MEICSPPSTFAGTILHPHRFCYVDLESFSEFFIHFRQFSEYKYKFFFLFIFFFSFFFRMMNSKCSQAEMRNFKSATIKIARIIQTIPAKSGDHIKNIISILYYNFFCNHFALIKISELHLFFLDEKFLIWIYPQKINGIFVVIYSPLICEKSSCCC